MLAHQRLWEVARDLVEQLQGVSSQFLLGGDLFQMLQQLQRIVHDNDGGVRNPAVMQIEEKHSTDKGRQISTHSSPVGFTWAAERTASPWETMQKKVHCQEVLESLSEHIVVVCSGIEEDDTALCLLLAQLRSSGLTEVWKTVETKCLPLQKRRPGRKALK